MPAELDILATENRRLLREVKDLRARVTAVESSRWWRVHPRLLVRRIRASFARPNEHQPLEASATPEPSSASKDGSLARFREEVVARGSFRSDMVSGRFPTWEPYLRELEGRAARILEIGSFEGMSACYFLWRLRDARLTCIDTFTGGASFAARDTDLSGIEAAFDRNVALVDGGRVRKLVGRSVDHLVELVREGAQFDLVFVDGSDLALDVLVDAALSWQLLAPGGLMIFDNYLWRSPLGEDPLFHPTPAIDAFVELIGNHCDVLVKDSQVILRRAAPSTAEAAPAEAATSAHL